jgi:diguanylate cyclase (GGDEF)-like protein
LNKANKKLTRWIILLPILAVILTSFILILIGSDFINSIYKNEIKSFRIEAIKNFKLNSIKKITEIEKRFLMNEKILEKIEKEKLRDIVSTTVSLMQDFYEKNPYQNKETLSKYIKNILRDKRFFSNKSGYFFMYDLNGVCLLMPPNPSMEGKNLIYLKDSKGNFTIKRHIDKVKSSSFGFDEWYWYKPNENKMKKKIGYVEIFKPLNAYIGTARYEEDILNEIKKDILTRLNNHSIEENLFIYNSKGKKLYGDFDPFNPKEILDIKKASLMIDDSFFISKKELETFDVADATRAKSFYVKYIPIFDWIIGEKTYNKALLENIEHKKNSIKEKITTLQMDIMIIVFISLAIVVLFMFLISNKIKIILKDYQNSLLSKNEEINKQKIELIHQVYHDTLTSLPNRQMLSKRLDLAIKQSRKSDSKFAIIFLDVDNFKSINDSAGHDVGDLLLQQVGHTIQKNIRTSDLVARFGGDEFVILIDNYEGISDIVSILEKIKKSFEQSVKLGKNSYKISLSMGVSLYPFDAKNSEDILKNADIAMFRAKEEGRNRYKFFKQSMNEEVQTQIEIEKSLHVAIKNREFVLHYQPLVDGLTNKVCGVEALIRWNHPTKGLIYPDKFISIVEDCGLIIPMGMWIIEEAVSKISKWKKQGIDIQKVSINVAIKQFYSGDLVENINKILKKYNAQPEWIEIEVIERAFVQDYHKIIKVLNKLRAMGIGIAIDDFGTGYSCLAYLKKLPITKLKIDREFVKDILINSEDRAIAKTIISLGKGLKLEVLAEGIENEKQKNILISMGCIKMQGFLFSKPVDEKAIEELFNQ